MKNGLVSVITPMYNAEKYIMKTIDSVLNQSFDNLELILVDDYSTDETVKLATEVSKRDHRVKVVTLPENSGAAVARNTGLDKAEGQYIAFIDSDDVWKKDKLEKQLDFMTANNYPFSFTAYETISVEGEQKKDFVSVPEKLSYTDLLKNTAIACSTVVIDRSIVGDFRMPLVRKGQDTATWLKILKTLPYAYGLNEVLSSYRKVPGSISSNKLGALKRTWNTYYRLEKLPLPKALYYFSCYVLNALKKRV